MFKISFSFSSADFICSSNSFFLAIKLCFVSCSHNNSSCFISVSFSMLSSFVSKLESFIPYFFLNFSISNCMFFSSSASPFIFLLISSFCKFISSIFWSCSCISFFNCWILAVILCISFLHVFSLSSSLAIPSFKPITSVFSFLLSSSPFDSISSLSFLISSFFCPIVFLSKFIFSFTLNISCFCLFILDSISCFFSSLSLI